MVPQMLSNEQRAIVGAYWWRRAEGELTSWVGFQHVLCDLRAERSPAAVIRLAERAVADERKHAEWCRDWALRFGHPQRELQARATEPITFRGATEQENRLLRIALCCFTETVGCFILRHVRPVVTDPELRKFNQVHMADELQHSRVGWGHLTAMNERQRGVLRGWLPALKHVLRIACCEGPEQPDEALVPFGYFTPRLLRGAHDEALRDVILPGLCHLQIGAVV